VEKLLNSFESKLPVMKNEKIVVGITQGDINSISYEVIIKALMDNRIMDFCIPVVYGSPKVAAYHRKALNIDNFSFNNIRAAEDANPKTRQYHKLYRRKHPC
jgi:4-hydroxythreonine-4-phosphate dehydrogenase